MSFIATIAPDAADGETAEMYRRQQASWGFVPNYAKVFGHRPEIMARWGRLLAEIKRPIDPRRFELVTFVAAHTLGNSACTLVHGKALRLFFSDAQILAIAADRLDGVLGAAEQAMLHFARQVAIDASMAYSSSVASVVGRPLVTRTAESPRPIPQMVRLPYISLSVANSEAMTVQSRVAGLVTMGPTMTRRVAARIAE